MTPSNPGANSRYQLHHPERLRLPHGQPRIVCQTRIKNEARWIRQVLDSMARVAHGIVIIDDGSTDDTPEICKAHPAVVDYIWQDHPLQDQVRDKDEALELALKYDPDWILCLDGDEVLEHSAPERILSAISTALPDISTFEFHFLYMWNDMQHYRVDGPYARVVHPRMFRVTGQPVDRLRYVPTTYAGNGHCKSVPGGLVGRSLEIDVKVLHLGYMYREVREQRYERYRNRDPEQFATGYYDHLLDQPGQQIVEWKERAADSPAHKQTLKPDYYYANARKNLVDLVPQDARRVLDVGCGLGATGALLKDTRGIEVIGIEIHPDVAAQAREKLSEVVVGDIETMTLPYPRHYFDCILLGDVLEHLIDPWKALKKLTSYLNPRGSIVASIPNIRNLGVIAKVLDGSWTYEEWGILDSTHLRFFALKNMYELFERAGIEAKLVEVVRDPLFEEFMKKPPTQAGNLERGRMILRNVAPEEINELTAQQFIFTGTLMASSAAKPSAQVSPRVSVIIPVFNNLEYTRQCITSLFAVKESTPFEVIVVNNGSTDGTAEYLAALGSAVQVVHLANNEGFAAGCNAGVREARGELIVFLNNDTIVQPGWLDEMVKCFDRDGDIGIVGNLQVFPDTGMVQQAGNVCGPNLLFYSIYHRLLPATHPAVNKPREFQFVAGSCLAVRAHLFDALGGFDEGFVNSYEDIDLCLRARQTGKKVWYCPLSRILHFESRTVSGHPKSGANHERFMSLWKDKLVPDDEQYFAQDGFDQREMRAAHGIITTTISPSAKEQMNSTAEAVSNLSLGNIAILTTYNQHCGLAMYAESLVDALQNAGISPLILSEQTTALRGPDAPGVLRCWTRDVDGGEMLEELIRAKQIELLHINYGGMFALDGWLPAMLKQVRSTGVRVVTTFHATDSSVTELGDVARMSDRCIVHHAQNELELIALGGPLDRTEIVPIGIKAVTERDLTECKIAAGLDPTKKFVAVPGFVEPHKNMLSIIEALAQVRKFVNAELRILGGAHPSNPESPAYIEQCRQKANALGIAEHVKFAPGFLDERTRDAELQAADVIVLNYSSGRFEASAALMDALASGRPVISSSAPPFDTAIDLTLKVTQELDLARAIVYMLKYPFVARALKPKIKAYEAEWSWNKNGQRIGAIYRQVLQAPQASDVHVHAWYDTHPDDIYAEPLQRERIRWLVKKASGRILEIGPANGYVAEVTKAACAVDINPGRLAVCRALRPGTKFEYGDVVKGLPFEHFEFDCVLAPEIFEHVDFEDAVTALKECMRVGRRVLVTVPCADKPLYDPDLVHNPEHRWLVTKQTVTQLLASARAVHFEWDASGDHDFYLLDIQSDSKQQQPVITSRVKALPTIELIPGTPRNIAVDASLFNDRPSLLRGIGRYTMEQLGAMMDSRPQWHFTFYADDVHLARGRAEHFLPAAKDRMRAWSEFSPEDHDLLYLPHPLDVGVPKRVQLAVEAELPIACTFYDLIPLIYPQSYLDSNAAYKEFYVGQLQLMRRCCDLFFCISQTTADDLRKHLSVPLARLRTIHAGVTPIGESSISEFENAELRRGDVARSEFLLFVGVPDPRKNPLALFFSLAAVRGVLNRPVKLVIAGDVPVALRNQLLQLQAICNLPEDAVCYSGFVSDNDLNLLYRQTRLLLFPSLYEGFGFPMVEAMAAGCPVVAGDNSSLREIAGDGALLVPATQPEAVAKAVLEVFTNEQTRNRLISAGKQQAARFTWRKVAEKTCIYLTEFLARREERVARSKSAQNSAVQAGATTLI